MALGPELEGPGGGPGPPGQSPPRGRAGHRLSDYGDGGTGTMIGHTRWADRTPARGPVVAVTVTIAVPGPASLMIRGCD
eukprot:245182-Hanusia_phi.AAC.1